MRLVTHLNRCRAGLGAVLLFFPALVVCLLAGPPLERGSRRIIRLLGIRQLSQALVTGNRASVAVIGAEVDVAHAASIMTLALCSRRWRRAALVDAVIASLFALAGAAIARTEPPTAQDRTSTSAARRAACSTRRFVPERLVRDPDVPDHSMRSGGPESPQGGSHA